MSYLPIIFNETPQSEVTALKLRLLFNKLPSEIGSLAKDVITELKWVILLRKSITSKFNYGIFSN